MREGERVGVGINGKHSLWIYKFKQSSKWWWFSLRREGGESFVVLWRVSGSY